MPATAGRDAQLTTTAAYGRQASADVYAGTFTDFAVRAGDTDLTNFGTSTLAAGTVTQIYVYGGADGAAGAFSFTFPLATCPSSTTSPGGTVVAPNGPGGTAVSDPSSSPLPSDTPAPPAVAIRSSKPPTYIG